MVKLESISLRSSDKFNERWVQDRIVDDPSILGLGDLVVKDKERIQVKAGRLDLLLQDPETLKRYESRYNSVQLMKATSFVRSSIGILKESDTRNTSM